MRARLPLAAGLIGIAGLALAGAGAGCGWGSGPGDAGQQPAGPAFPGVEVSVGAVGDPAILAGVETQRGEWSATRGGTVAVRREGLAPDAAADGADVLLFPGRMLGALVDAGALASIPAELTRPPSARSEFALEAPEPPADDADPDAPPADPLNFADVLPAFKDGATRYGADRFGLPVGGSALVLVLNRAAFADESARAEAAESGLKLEAPKTWDELDALAGFLQGRDWDGDGQPEHGIALALGADPDGLGDATFLARAAALGQHPDQYSFLFDADDAAPRVASPPFLEALEKLVALKAAGPPGMEGFDASAARAAFAAGDAAMLVDRAERASAWGTHPVDVAPLPGSARVYDPARKAYQDASPPNRPSYLPDGGGWLVGVSSNAQGTRRDAALDLAAYLAAPDVSNRIRAERSFPLLPTRQEQLGQGLLDPRSAPGVDPRRWAEAVASTLTASRAVLDPRIPGAEAYLDALSAARAAAAQGEPAGAALESAARAWVEQTEALGPARQLWHYRRSLNTLATAPEPPPRGT